VALSAHCEAVLPEQSASDLGPPTVAQRCSDGQLVLRWSIGAQMVN
jgi:hypothetical protein